jgi:hypothetical protein
MTQSRLFRLLLQPSLFSGTIVFSLTAIIIGSNAWAYVSTKQLFYEYVFGPYGIKTYLWQQSVGIESTRNAVLTSPAAYYTFVAFAAVIIGLAIYVLLQCIGLALSWRTWSGLDALGPNRQAIARELSRRLVLRIVTLIGWAFYSAGFFNLLLPSATLLNRVGVEHIQNGSLAGWALCAAAAGILAIVLHVQVIFLRLVCLRPRVFGGADKIEEAETKDHRL